MPQAAVAGLAGDRAQRKTWCVAIVSALFGLARAANSGRIAAAAIIPTGVFGFVDAAYLANGKPYRFATTQSSRKSWTSATVSLASPI